MLGFVSRATDLRHITAIVTITGAITRGAELPIDMLHRDLAGGRCIKWLFQRSPYCPERVRTRNQNTCLQYFFSFPSHLAYQRPRGRINRKEVSVSSCHDCISCKQCMHDRSCRLAVVSTYISVVNSNLSTFVYSSETAKNLVEECAVDDDECEGSGGSSIEITFQRVDFQVPSSRQSLLTVMFSKNDRENTVAGSASTQFATPK
ncbi:hypothetical protein F5884DRAFT_537492 [Xylogone sp. PMI_703]|nr:hypothetical protein F5884DRAFT_537492 [Xylogone sp. PMI_703]